MYRHRDNMETDILRPAGLTRDRRGYNITSRGAAGYTHTEGSGEPGQLTARITRSGKTARVRLSRWSVGRPSYFQPSFHARS